MAAAIGVEGDVVFATDEVIGVRSGCCKLRFMY